MAGAAVAGVSPVERAKPVFASLEAGRGIAALLVVLYHVSTLVAAPQYWNRSAFGGVFAFGHAGVEFFFVLSGFIIAHVHARDIGRPERLAAYATKRFVRVVPLYWLVLAVLLAGVAIFGLPRSVARLDLTAIVSSFLLAGPDAHTGVLTVAWTLFHEMFFYLVFGALIADRRVGTLLVAAWLALIAADAAVGVPGLPRYITSPLNLLFFAGVGVRVVVDRVRLPAPRTVAAVGVAAFVALGVEEVAVDGLAPIVRNLGFGVAAAVALAGIIAAEGRAALRPGRVAMRLGAASYSIYLVHFPVMLIFAKAMTALGLVARVPAEVGLVVIAGLATALGVVVHRRVEVPLTRALAPARRALRAGTVAG